MVSYKGLISSKESRKEPSALFLIFKDGKTISLGDDIKVLEILGFLELGIFETLGSKISHGASKKFADVRTHFRKVSKNIILQKRA